jgi:hypothetical protein
MRRSWVVYLVLVVLAALLLAGCDAYSETGSSSKCSSNPNGGRCEFRAKKANGTSTKDLEVESLAGALLEADVVLTVGTGTYTIELLGKDDAVTLALEARDGQTVSGHGQIQVDTFGAGSIRVTAVEAENVEYAIEFWR